MNSFQIWIKAQVFNIIIGLLIFFVSVIYQSIQIRFESDEYLGNMIIVLFIFILVSIICGIPLMGLFKLIEIGIENSHLNKTEKRIIEIVAYPFGTFFYLVLLSFLLSINEFKHIRYDITLGLSAPAIISTLISVLVNQYQIKKNKENENSILES